ncbi:bifunctional metallophosphatase/5'-nucleotidase [bacterium]
MRGNVLGELQYAADLDKNVYQGGIVILKNFMEKQQKPYLFLDTGNNLCPTPENIFSRGDYILKFMEDLHYDAMSLGSCEFSWGQANLRRFSSFLSFPFLSANIEDKTKGSKSFFIPYTVKSIKGVKFGIIGVSSEETLIRNLDSQVKDFEMKPIFQTLKKYIKILKEDEKVDVVIVLSRFDVSENPEGDEENAIRIDNIMLANEIPNIDIIIGRGTDFSFYPEGVIASESKTIICQPLNKAKAVGKLSLVVRQINKKVVTFNNELILLQEEDAGQDYSEFTNIKQKHLDTSIGRTEFLLSKKKEEASNLGMLITDTMRKKTEADIALLENKDIINSLHIGKITYRDVFHIFAYDYKIIVEELEGRDIKKLLEMGIYNSGENYINVSGFKYSFDKSLPVYSKVTAIIMDTEQDFEEDKIYKVALLERMLNTKIDSKIYRTAKKISYTDFTIREIIEDYIGTHVPIEEKYRD